MLSPGLLIIAGIFLSVVFQAISSGGDKKPKAFTATVIRTTHDQFIDDDDKISNKYFVTVETQEPYARKEYSISRKDYGLLCEGDEVELSLTGEGFVECSIRYQSASKRDVKELSQVR